MDEAELQKVAEAIRLHRLRWPAARIVADPASFRAEAERLLRLLPPAAESFEWLDESWAARLFPDAEGSVSPPPRDPAAR